MKKILFLMLLNILPMGKAWLGHAQTAQSVLDKTAALVGSKSGAQASFQISSAKIGNTSGTIAIKGNKFNARTPEATVWFNGKTQWTYMKKTDEVNVSNPTQAQQTQMNPLTFINLYKTGFTLTMKTVEGKYEVRMQAQNKSRSIQEMYIVIDPGTYAPTQVRMRQKNNWTSINIFNFKATKQSDKIFTFDKADFPTAEIVDLR